MPKFIYKAKRGPGELIQGTIDADNLDNAIDKVMRLGLSPLDVSSDTPSSQQPASREEKKFALSFSNRITFNQLGNFTRQLGDLIDAGIPMLRALRITEQQTGNPNLKQIIEQIYGFVQDGGTLSEALAQHPKVFSRFYINMVKTGEMAGNLDKILNRLSEFIDKDLETRSKVQSSMAYPVFMLLVGIGTIFVILTFVIPRLTLIFEDLTESLPLPTIVLMAVSHFFAKFWWLILAVAGLGLGYLRNYVSSPVGKEKLDAFKLKLPLLGHFIKDVEIGRFARTLATLLDSGVVIVSALESVWAVLDNEVLKKEIKQAAGEVASGSSLSLALRQCPHFPEIAVNMIAVGEESGHLETSLYKLAGAYERQSDRTVKTMTSLLEPMLILGIGLIVGFMFVAILLPIFRINLLIK